MSRSAASTHLRNPRRFHLIVGFSLAIIGAVLFWWLLGQHSTLAIWLGGWLVAINFVAFGYYGYDKAQAQKVGRARIPESVLHTFSVAGGSLGAFLGMRFFRHKTMKGRFRILFWCIVVLQAAAAAWVVWWISSNPVDHG